MSALEDLLSMPAEWEKRPEAWHRVTNGDALFCALHEAVRSSVAYDWDQTNNLLLRWKEEYLAYKINHRQKKELDSQWKLVCRLVWCAEQAAKQGELYLTEHPTEIDRVFFALTPTPDCINQDKAWAWVCIRTMLDAPARQVKVPVALWDQSQGENGGFIATLVLEVMDGGAGQVVHHPVDAFVSQFDQAFSDSMQDAWTLARKQARAEGANVLRCDGRWRLLRDERPMRQVSGRSASGAALRGWLYALQRMTPDEGVVVLGQVAADGSGRLEGVNGVRAKVKAINAATRFDTIVIVSDEDERDTKEALGKPTHISVVKLSQ